MADVGSDGPFSRFEGYDRVIMVLDGVGMTLHLDGPDAIALRPFEPAPFSGDWTVDGKLTAGPVRDFNVIVDRSRASATLVVEDLTAPTTFEVAPNETCIVYVIAGGLDTATTADTIVADATFTITPNPEAHVAIVRIQTK
jgi:environmental stress-induced protein Ves